MHAQFVTSAPNSIISYIHQLNGVVFQDVVPRSNEISTTPLFSVLTAVITNNRSLPEQMLDGRIICNGVLQHIANHMLQALHSNDDTSIWNEIESLIKQVSPANELVIGVIDSTNSSVYNDIVRKITNTCGGIVFDIAGTNMNDLHMSLGNYMNICSKSLTLGKKGINSAA